MTQILLSTDAVGGVWTYALDLARGLSQRGHHAALAVLGPSPSDAQADAAQAAGLDVIDTKLPLDWTATDEAELGRAATALAGIAAARRADIVHLSSPALAGAAQFPMAVVGIAHSCLATWWAALREGPPPADFAWRIAATARGYAACDAVIAPSAAFAAATRLAYGVSPTCIHNGRAPAAAVPGPRDIAVATAGRLWDEGKGAATLDEAAGLLGTPILALGPTAGPQGQRVALDRLCLLGSRPAADVARTLAHTRIFVSAARYEPFGLAVLEAAQAGCALLLSDIPTFRELWDGAAMFVPPGDASGFAAALTTLLRDPGTVEQLAAAATIRAQRFTLDRCVEAVCTVHRAALRQPGIAA